VTADTIWWLFVANCNSFLSSSETLVFPNKMLSEVSGLVSFNDIGEMKKHTEFLLPHFRGKPKNDQGLRKNVHV
jgi:hypothetical protein